MPPVRRLGGVFDRVHASGVPVSDHPRRRRAAGRCQPEICGGFGSALVTEGAGACRPGLTSPQESLETSVSATIRPFEKLSSPGHCHPEAKTKDPQLLFGVLRWQYFRIGAHPLACTNFGNGFSLKLVGLIQEVRQEQGSSKKIYGDSEPEGFWFLVAVCTAASSGANSEVHRTQCQ